MLKISTDTFFASVKKRHNTLHRDKNDNGRAKRVLRAAAGMVR